MSVYFLISTRQQTSLLLIIITFNHSAVSVFFKALKYLIKALFAYIYMICAGHCFQYVFEISLIRDYESNKVCEVTENVYTGLHVQFVNL